MPERWRAVWELPLCPAGKDEYQDLKRTYQQRRNAAEEQSEKLREEMNREMELPNRSWMEQFRKHRNITALERRLVVRID